MSVAVGEIEESDVKRTKILQETEPKCSLGSRGCRCARGRLLAAAQVLVLLLQNRVDGSSGKVLCGVWVVFEWSTLGLK